MARRLGLTFIDTDSLVEKSAAKNISAIFQQDGEASFRKLEREAVEEALRARNAVIACGGGVVLDPANLERLGEAGLVVYLEIDAASAAVRLGDGGGRPLLERKDVPAELERLIAQRREAYERAAHVKVDASGGVEEVVERILSSIGSMGAWGRLES